MNSDTSVLTSSCHLLVKKSRNFAVQSYMLLTVREKKSGERYKISTSAVVVISPDKVEMYGQ